MIRIERTYGRSSALFGGIGVVIGLFIIHPVAMLVSTMGGPNGRLNWRFLHDTFSGSHLMMSAWFAMLGAAVGVLFGVMHARMTGAERTVALLRRILTVCAVCRKVKIERNGKPEWIDVMQYMHQETETSVSHGYCPVCYEHLKDQIRELKT